MPNIAETAANRKQTTAFMGFDPIAVVLQHADIISTPSGGKLKGPAMSRVSQTARLLPVGQGLTAPVREMLDGESVSATFVLLLSWDAVIERGDWFYLNGLKYEVVWVPDTVDRTYQVKCEVALRG